MLSLLVDLARFCFDHPGAWLVPAEHLAPDGGGVRPGFADLLRARRGVDADALALLDRALALYHARVGDLAARAPGAWMAPRVANLLVVTDPARVEPYAQPFRGTSWFLYESDLDPARSHPEYAAFALVYAEAAGFWQRLTAAAGYSVSYWLERTDAEVEAFARAASRAARPDAGAFAALARALPWVREEVCQVPLRPPPALAPPDAFTRVEGAELLVPARRAPEFVALCRGFESAATEAALAAMGARDERASNAAADALCAWLREARPELAIADATGAVVWQPGPHAADTAAVRAALAGVTPDAAASLRADFEVVSAQSRAFLASVREPEALPRASAEVEAGGGVYLRADLRRVVYELAQPGFDPLRVAAPPFHRLLLAARTAHEWGHLAHEAGWVAVPARRRAEHAEAVRALEACFQAIVRAVPARLADDVAGELAALGGNRVDAGATLARVALGRVGDWAANVLARRYLAPEAVEAYVRNNARHHLNEGVGLLGLLTRHAIEWQYLRLAAVDDPLGYFFATSWFGEYFVRSGVVREEDMRALFDAAGRVCEAYEVDPARLAPPTVAG